MSNAQNTNLLFAVHSDDVEEMKRAISMGADKNAKYNMGITPAMDAVSYGAFNALRYLVSIGADLLVQDENGATCLCYLNSDNENIVDMFFYLIKQPKLIDSIIKRNKLINNIFDNEYQDVSRILEDMCEYE